MGVFEFRNIGGEAKSLAATLVHLSEEEVPSVSDECSSSNTGSSLRIKALHICCLEPKCSGPDEQNIRIPPSAKTAGTAAQE